MDDQCNCKAVALIQGYWEAI